MIEQLTPGLAGQILVTVILAVVAGLALVALGLWLFIRFTVWQEERECTEQMRRKAEAEARFELLPRGLAPMPPDLDDEVHEDHEHMRVVREAAEVAR